MAQAQIPTTGLIKDYKFTNGVLTSDVNPVLNSGNATLVPAGTTRTVIADRNAEANKAISLNSDSFTAGGTNNQFVNSFGISFWVKTSTNTTEKKYIFDQFVQTNPCGWSVALQNGKIVFNAQSNVSTNSIYTYGQIAEITSTANVDDNIWHHVYCQAKTTTTSYFDGAFVHNTGTTIYDLYIDNILVATDTKILVGYHTTTEVFRRRAILSTQQLSVGKSTNVANTGIYNEGLDQIRYYETSLIPAEIEQLYIEDKPLSPIYVNSNATGSNNGTSWADAYTNLQTAIDAAVASINEIWVAAGTYKPNGTARTSSFLMKSNIKIYGGFNGSEITREQRNQTINTTILSGDVSGNDNATILATETTRQDNTYHVISLRGNVRDVYIDGFTISGGNANGGTLTTGGGASQYYHTRGGAIYLNPYTANDNTSIKLQNCILEKNSGSDTGVFAGYFANSVSNLSYNGIFENCIIRNNYSGTNAQFLVSGASGFGWYGNVTITNSLFHNNVSTSGASCLYLSASFANSGTALGINTNIINCTFSNNTGVNGNVLRTDNGSNSYVRNSIIYGNGSTSPINPTGTGGSLLTNTISEGGQIGGINSNPYLHTNYTLLPASPAINAGNNSYIPGSVSLDLAGNARIVGTNVDMGAYEYDAALSIESPNISNIFSVYPNPTNGLITIETDQEIKSVKLFSLDGKLLLEGQNSNLQIDNFPSGIYMLYLESVNGTTLYKKIIKN
jgi:hypothetical protein